MLLQYETSNFGKHWGPRLASPNVDLVHADWLDLCWAAITVGKPQRSHLAKHGLSSYYDALAQLSIIRSILDQDLFYTRSSLQGDQDPTEKAFSSYKTGMTLSRLLSAQLFGVRYLFHLSFLKNIPCATTFANKKHPDLIGLDANNNWIVVEAKGTSGSYSATMTSSGKRQTRSLRKINGQFPNLRCVVQSHYLNDDLCVHLSDPDEYDEDAEDLEFDLQLAMEIYYSSLHPLGMSPSAERRINGSNYQLYTHGYPGLELGVPTEPAWIQTSSPLNEWPLWSDLGDGYRRYLDGLVLRDLDVNG